MKWTDLTTTACGILRDGQPMIIALAGTNAKPPFLWYWSGDMNIRAIPGGSFDETDGAIIGADGKVHGWVSRLTDMPEINDINQAVAQHAAMVEETRKPDFQIYLAEQLQMATNMIKAGPDTEEQGE